MHNISGLPQWHEDVDVVVIGSGLAGLSAAVEAVEHGASVIVIEKMKITGGNSRISDGGVAAPNNFLQKKNGIEDSPECFCNDVIRAGLGLNHANLVKVLADSAADAVAKDLFPILAQIDYPLAVVDEKHRLKGIVVRGALLAALSENVQDNGAS
jgi:ribulose 1,5-bisphosphate synthetase/thiazole synthase